MTSRRENLTSRRGRELRKLTSRREISRRDVTERATQDLFYTNTPVFENSPLVNFPLDVEHSVRLAPMLPSPEIKPTNRKIDHGYS